MKLKIRYELVILVLFFILLNWIGYANFSDNKIAHDYPFGYRSSDMTERAFMAESIKDVGHFKYLAPYITQGLTKIIPYYYPSIEHLPVSLSIMSGLETYDTLYFIVFLMMNLSAIMMYFLIRKYNPNIALLSLPFMTFLYLRRFLIGSAVGIWGYSAAELFLVCTLFLFTYFENGKIYILVSLFLVSMIHFRLSPAIVAFVFFSLYFAIKVITKKWNKELTKKTIIMGIITIIFSSYFLILLAGFGGQISKSGPLIDFNKLDDQFYGTRPTDFGFLLLTIMIIGIVISLIYIKKYIIPSLIGLILIGFNYADYLGGKIAVLFYSRAFMLPIYVAFFFGLVFYFLILLSNNIIKGKVKIKTILTLIILTTIVLFTQFEPLQGKEGLFNKDMWDGFKWINENTQLNSNVLLLYGDSYDQVNMLRFIKRNPFIVQIGEIQKQISENTIERKQNIRPIYNLFIYKKDIFSFGDLLEEQEKYDDTDQDMEHFYNYVMGRTKPMDLCSFDYYIIDKHSRYPVLISNFNNRFKELALNKNWFSIAYENNFLTILKNDKKGAECIG